MTVDARSRHGGARPAGRIARRVLPLLGVVAMVAAACAPSPPPELTPQPPPSDLRVMTYNVLGAQADAAVFSEHAGWAARIDQLRPDVVVVQEAQSEDVAALRALPADDYALAAYRQWACDGKGSREGVAILVRDGIEVLDGGGTNVGSSCSDPTVRRVLVWAELRLAGGPVRIYGTHLTAGDGTAVASRTNQIRLIRERIAADDPVGDDRWLLAGDMNFTPGSTDHHLMLDGDASAPPSSPDPGPMLDAHAEVEPSAANPSACPTYATGDAAAQAYLLSRPDLVRACGYTAGWVKDSNLLGCDLLSFCTAWQVRAATSVTSRIDMVLRPAGGPFRVIDSFVPNRADADWAAPGAEWFRLSDHLPHLVDLELTTSPT